MEGKEDVPSDLIASCRWEAVLLFDNMKFRNKEAKNLGNQERRTESRIQKGRF